MRRALQHPDDGRIPGDRRVGATYLGAGQGGLPIRLADVASVRRRLADAEVRVRAQGASAVGIAVEMLPDRNAIELGQRVRRLLDTRDLPAGMHSVMVADEPTYVAERLSLLALSLHRRSGGGGRLMKWIEPLYRPLLDSAVRRPRRVLGGFVGLIALTLAMMAAWLWPPVFFPDADRHQFLVKVQLPTGHLSRRPMRWWRASRPGWRAIPIWSTGRPSWAVTRRSSTTTSSTTVAPRTWHRSS
jgi:multidrug efflux pump subunit AcrB